MRDDITVRRSGQDDLDALRAMRRRVEERFVEQGIRQWPLGSGDAPWFADAFTSGRGWVAVDADGQIVAAATLEDTDENVWPDDPRGEARYVHGFMTDQGVALPGDGADLLRWLERRAAHEGARFVRLDCVADNPRLRQFYLDLAYAEVGRREFGDHWYVAALFEKPLPPPLPDPLDARWPRTTARTLLRTVEVGDADAMLTYRSDPEVCRYLAHPPLDREGVVERVVGRIRGVDPTPGRLVRGVAVVVDGEVVGDAMLRTQPGTGGAPELWIGYALAPQAWGRGLGTEIATELRRVGGEMRLPVYADARPGNTASIRVLEKIGLQRRDDLSRGDHVTFSSPGAPHPDCL